MLKLMYTVDYAHLKNNVPTYSGILIQTLAMRIYSTFDVQSIINSTVTPQQTQNDVLYWKRCVIIKIRKRNEILAKNANVTTKQKHSSQSLVSSITLLPRPSVQSGPFPRNERQPALSQGFRGFIWKSGSYILRYYTKTVVSNASILAKVTT